MRTLIYNLLFTFIILSNTYAQVYTGTYRSVSNPYYWQNKKPYLGYWQQDVHYSINAMLDDSNDILKGDLKLVYYNNSPDVLRQIYFHVNENAFTPNSYYHNLYANNKNKAKFGKNASKGLGTSVENIKANGVSVSNIVYDNTVFRFDMNENLNPNDSVVITMDFATYFDLDASMRRRMKVFKTIQNLKHYDAVHWYPQICVYDSKFGWNTDQHLDKEFYNNFGTYEATLHLPQHYIMDATGVLQNEAEVYADSLKEKIKLSNFFKRKPSDPISQPIAFSNKLKTWKFRAVNVHNFAFTADPLYRIDETEWNGIKAIALVQEQNAPNWKGAVQFAAKVIKVYSEDFGIYVWPKIIIADAKDGMEYPMLTLDDRSYPQNQQLLAHEIGHMWFYGMLGSNETYRASMDEGFTQYLTVWAMNKITGAVKNRYSPNKMLSKRLKKSEVKYDRLYNSYIASVHKGYDEPLNTHSCAFNGAIRHGGNYGLVYFKTGVMLDNLRYTLGDSVFFMLMKEYVSKWKICHPYPEDFRNVATHFTHTDLNWFFDQWLETTKTIDYQVNKPKLIRSDSNKFVYTLHLSRKGRMHMPLNISITDVKGLKYNYYIPNTWYIKPTKDSILQKWYGWDLLQPNYSQNVSLKNKIKSIQIDTSYTLADIDLRNNHWHQKNPIKLNVFAPNPITWDKTDKLIRPDLWYNSFDGVQVGVDFQKKYFMDLTNYNFQFFLNTGLLQGAIPENYKRRFNLISYNFTLKNNFNKVLKYSYLNIHSMWIAGVIKNSVGIEKILKKQDDQNPRFWVLGGNVVQLYRSRNIDKLYLSQYPNLNYGQLHTYLQLFADRKYILHHKPAAFKIELRTPFVLSRYNYNFAQFTHWYSTAWKKFEIRTRLFSRITHSNRGRIPYESLLQTNGASVEDMYDSKYYRARGVFPTDWQNSNSIISSQLGGGLSIRGVEGAAYSGVSGNLEIDFDQFIKLKPKKWNRNFSFDLYTFADGGFYNLVNINQINHKIHSAANVGLGGAIKFNFGAFQIRPLYIRVDWPALTYTSQKLPTSKIVVGIGRSF